MPSFSSGQYGQYDQYGQVQYRRSSPFVQSTSLKINLPAREVKRVDIENFIQNLDIESYASLDFEKQEEFLEKIDAFELFNTMKELDDQLGHVKLEIHFLTEFLEQNNPRLLIGIKQRRSSVGGVRKSVASVPLTVPSGTSTSGTDSSRRSVTGPNTISTNRRGSRKVIAEYHINFKTKADMAEKATLEVDKCVKTMQKEAREKMRAMRAEIEELRCRTEETDETCKNFVLHFMADDDDIVFLETASERKIIDKLQKFTNNWFKSGRCLMATMRLRINHLEDRCRQYRTELNMKSDISKVLNAVDFDQLLIKRAQLLNDLDEQYVNMNGIKNKTGKASMAMGEEKASMMMLEEKHKFVKEKIQEMIKTIAKLEEECKTAKLHNKKDMKVMEQMEAKLERYQAPSVASYIWHKDEIFSLEKEEKILKRKINIMNMKLLSLNKQYKLRKHAET